jgi:hypothetical protein
MRILDCLPLFSLWYGGVRLILALLPMLHCLSCLNGRVVGKPHLTLGEGFP